MRDHQAYEIAEDRRLAHEIVARGSGRFPLPPRNSSSLSGGKEKPPERPLSLAPISEPNGRAKNGLEPATSGVRGLNNGLQSSSPGR
jgi:hypothetical protein